MYAKHADVNLRNPSRIHIFNHCEEDRNVEGHKCDFILTDLTIADLNGMAS